MKKNFITGFIAGGIICAAVTGFAVEYAVTANPYPVKVNGVETTIQGYNINDETYFKLRDVSAAVGGFEVGFEDNAIIVNTPNKPTSAPTPTVNPNLSPLPEVEIETVDGEEYVRKSNIKKMLSSIGLNDYDFALHSFYNINDLHQQGTTLLETVELHPTNNELIPVEYYNNTLVPLILTLR